MVKNPSNIKNKAKRKEVYAKYKQQKKKTKKELRAARVKEIEALGDKAPPKQIPRTIENTRELDETVVQPDDVEVIGDEKDDEFSKYFSNEVKPKLMISTRPKCSRKLFPFIGDLMQTIPNAFYYPRANHHIKDLAKYAANKKFTHLVMLSEKDKACNGLIITHLPVGPTVFLKVSSFVPGEKIPGHGRPTSHIPELILNNFKTRLGRRVGRFLGSLFPHVSTHIKTDIIKTEDNTYGEYFACYYYIDIR